MLGDSNEVAAEAAGRGLGLLYRLAEGAFLRLQIEFSVLIISLIGDETIRKSLVQMLVRTLAGTQNDSNMIVHNLM
jgi:hypothetical protein